MGKLYSYIVVFVFLNAITRPAGAQTWHWAAAAGGDKADYIGGMANDGNGSVVVASGFRGSAVYGDSAFTAASSTGVDQVLTRYDSRGRILWTRHFPVRFGYGYNNYDDVPLFVDIDRDKNIYATGALYYYDGFTVDGVLFQQVAGKSRCFIVALDSSGTVKWVQLIDKHGVYMHNMLRSVKVLRSGDILVSGDSEDLLGINRRKKAFLALFANDGQEKWFSTIPGEDTGKQIASGARCLYEDPSGDIYIAGRNTMTGTVNPIIDERMSPPGIYLAKFTASGTHVWTQINPDSTQSNNVIEDKFARVLALHGNGTGRLYCYFANDKKRQDFGKGMTFSADKSCRAGYHAVLDTSGAVISVSPFSLLYDGPDRYSGIVAEETFAFNSCIYEDDGSFCLAGTMIGRNELRDGTVLVSDSGAMNKNTKDALFLELNADFTLKRFICNTGSGAEQGYVLNRIGNSGAYAMAGVFRSSRGAYTRFGDSLFTSRGTIEADVFVTSFTPGVYSDNENGIASQAGGGFPVTVYPNPASGYVYVDIPRAGDFRMRLLSPEGKIFSDKRIKGGRHAVPLTEIPPGIYLLQLTDREHSVVRKISLY
jgi:hypothetical protein